MYKAGDVLKLTVTLEVVSDTDAGLKVIVPASVKGQAVEAMISHETLAFYAPILGIVATPKGV